MNCTQCGFLFTQYSHNRPVTIRYFFWLRTVNPSISVPQFQVTIGSESIEWIPLTCLLVFMAGYSIGFGIIPWFLMAELTPSDTRSISCSVAYAFGQVCLFVAVKTFLDVIELIDAYGTFWVYSGVSLLGVIFVFFCVPETSNLRDNEIEDIFQNNRVDFDEKQQSQSGFVTRDTNF